MSDGRGSINVSGSAATIAALSSLGKATPITVSSLENPTNTSLPTRNLMRSPTSTSYDLGRAEVTRRTSSTVITTATIAASSDSPSRSTKWRALLGNRLRNVGLGVAVGADAVDEQLQSEGESSVGV